jgi:hypothetical protein
VRLQPLPRPPAHTPALAPLSESELERRRLRALQQIQEIKKSLCYSVTPTGPTTDFPANHEASPTAQFGENSTK